MPGLNGGRGLTINTEVPPEPAQAPPVEDGKSSKQGTPRRNWLGGNQNNGGPAPNRSWLQSPRKWAGRTPTNASMAAGGATPNTIRTATYYATLQKPTGDQLFGKDEEEPGSARADANKDNNKSGATPKAGGTPKAGSGNTPVNISNIMHQTDKNGKQQTAQPLQQQQQPAPQTPAQAQQQTAAATAAATNNNNMNNNNAQQQGANGKNGTLWGRFVGCFQQGSNEQPGVTMTTAGTGVAAQTSEKTPEAKAKKPTSTRRRNGLLGEPHPDDVGKKCLILDLDETLVHSSFQPVDDADFIIPIKIEDTIHKVYVLKRPGVDEYMTRMAKDYEIVIFTASLSLYADPLLDQLDTSKVIRHRLFRESCTYYQGNYVKDLSKIDRDIEQTIIVDNSPLSYMFQPENAIGCSTFIDEPTDRELDVIARFLEDIVDVEDVRDHCKYWRDWAKKGGESHRMVRGG